VKTIPLIAVALVAVLITGILYYNATYNPNNGTLDQATPTPKPDVKITNFTCLGVWHGTTLGPMLDLFSLNYTNNGMIDIQNLTLTLNTNKTDENYTDPNHHTTSEYNPYRFLDEVINGETYPLENLKAGQTKSFEKTYFMDSGFLLVQPFALTVTLKSNNTVLDQATRMIPISG
jgi:hypothetical protein